MATKKAGGTTENGRDSNSKRRGVKLFGGQQTKAGGIIIRQKGSRYFPGQNVGIGSDFTLFALKDGIVNFQEKKRRRFDGSVRVQTYVNIVTA